jgi:acyl-CoA synthetase (NDP forming)
MSALRSLANYHQFRKSWQIKGQKKSAAILAHPKLPAGFLPTEAAFRLLDSFGISVVPTLLTHDAEDAATAAEHIGFPVALKIESAQIAHKSDIGGVVLNLTNASEVRAAFTRTKNQVATQNPGAEIAGVVVQRMAPDGIEMILGIKRDPLFGPVIICGFGGIFVELLKDVAIGIPPVSREDAHSLLQGLRGWTLLTGLRGKPPADVDALCDTIVSVSNLAVSLGEQLLALDINPLVVHARNHGAVAVDALVQIA